MDNIHACWDGLHGRFLGWPPWFLRVQPTGHFLGWPTWTNPGKAYLDNSWGALHERVFVWRTSTPCEMASGMASSTALFLFFYNKKSCNLLRSFSLKYEQNPLCGAAPLKRFSIYGDR